MGKKSWFSAVRKVVSTSYLKENKHKKSHNKSKSTKKSRNENQMSFDTSLSPTNAPLCTLPIHHIDEPEFKQPENEPVKQHSIAIVMEEESTAIVMEEESTNEPMKQDSIAIVMEEESTAIVMEEESTNAISQDNTEVDCVTSAPSFVGQSREDIAAIKIQKAYRGYMVRNGSNPLKAWRRLKMYMQAQSVKRQCESTLTSMQTMTRVQSQVHTRKIRMAEVNEALQQQLQQKRLNKLNATKCTEKSGWNLSSKSKEQSDADLLKKKEAAERREKVLAFSYTRQQTWRKNLPKSTDSNRADWEWNTVGVMNKRVSVSRQSPPAKVAAQSTKSVKTWTPMSSSGTKRGPSTGAVVGSAKKRVEV
ncbi:hypothetical protein L2E82_22514 [Cichorium intybus]|uniref:Uncharacterized protein n=1 Tax=Cichorium intybus TaxID=13427 RepID=A0ACB9DYL8_CICIN|nr:hypothetical protein L2E82_22514 [Cichorium intybus]